MRKIICCALALLLMMGAAVVPAAAAETKTGFYDFQDVDDVKITAKDATGLVTDGSDRMEVVYSKATSGNLYNVYLVEGNSLDVLESDSTKVYYIDQAASTGTSITVNVIPKLPTSDKDMTLFIIGDDETTKVSVSMKYGAGASSDYMVGDVNADGKVNAQDRLIIVRYLAKWDNYDKEIKSWDATDINKDGKFNAQDRLIIVRYLAKWGGEYDEYFK